MKIMPSHGKGYAINQELPFVSNFFINNLVISSLSLEEFVLRNQYKWEGITVSLFIKLYFVAVEIFVHDNIKITIKYHEMVLPLESYVETWFLDLYCVFQI